MTVSSSPMTPISLPVVIQTSEPCDPGAWDEVATRRAIDGLDGVGVWGCTYRPRLPCCLLDSFLLLLLLASLCVVLMMDSCMRVSQSIERHQIRAKEHQHVLCDAMAAWRTLLPPRLHGFMHGEIDAAAGRRPLLMR